MKATLSRFAKSVVLIVGFSLQFSKAASLSSIDPKPVPPAALKTLELELGSNVTMSFIQVPVGRFMMGSPMDEKGRSDNEGVQQAAITNAFWLGIFEVTQEQYTAVIGINPSQMKGAGRPVEGVSWDDARAFCTRASEKTRRHFRLPTEAEWEYACRAGTKTRYCFGDDDNQLDGYAWYAGNSGGTTHPVGQKKPNAWGLFDMHGNVAEWCQDSYLGPTGANRRAPVAGALRVDRGGFWDYPASGCRSAKRLWCVPFGRNPYIGFRVVVTCSDGE